MAAVAFDPEDYFAHVDAANGDSPAPGHFPAADSAQLERAATPSHLIRCLTADEFFAKESDANLVVPALGICAGPPTGIVGQTYAGKSITTLSFGLSVACGKPLWGAWATQRGAWLHLDYEQGRRHTKKRIHRIARAMGVTDEELRDLFENRTVRVSVFPQINLTTDNAADHFKRAFEGVRLVTCDSLRCMIGAVSENASEVRDLLRVLTRASDATEAAVALIHHGGKTPDEASQRTRKEMSRGSSAIVDEFQSMLVMSKKKGDPVTLVTHEKDRELGHEAADFGLRIEDVAGGADGQEPNWGLRVLHVDRDQMRGTTPTADASFGRAVEAVRESIRANPGVAGIEAVAERAKLRRQTTSAAVKQLIADGDVVPVAGTRGGVRLFLKHMAPVEKS